METLVEQAASVVSQGQLDPKDTVELAELYNALRPDMHIKGSFNFRHRAYATGRLVDRQFAWEPAQEFVQGTEINTYAGGMRREFDSVPEAARPLIEKMIKGASEEVLEASVDYSVGVHMIRIKANTENWGLPAPEGIHQDGFDFVLTAVINTDNVSGGISSVLQNDEVVFQGEIAANEYVVFDDRAHFHYVSPVTPAVPGEATRDALIFTFERTI